MLRTLASATQRVPNTTLATGIAVNPVMKGTANAIRGIHLPCRPADPERQASDLLTRAIGLEGAKALDAAAQLYQHVVIAPETPMDLRLEALGKLNYLQANPERFA